MLMIRSAGNQYLTGLTLYFVGYVLFEVLISESYQKTSMLRCLGSLQHRPEIDLASSMASHAHACVGRRGHLARCHAEYVRLFRSSLLPRCHREWPFPRRGLLPVHVV